MRELLKNWDTKDNLNLYEKLLFKKTHGYCKIFLNIFFCHKCLQRSLSKLAQSIVLCNNCIYSIEQCSGNPTICKIQSDDKFFSWIMMDPCTWDGTSHVSYVAHRLLLYLFIYNQTTHAWSNEELIIMNITWERWWAKKCHTLIKSSLWRSIRVPTPKTIVPNRCNPCTQTSHNCSTSFSPIATSNF